MIQEGSCGCGKATFEIDLHDAKTLNCHCVDCQKHLGAPFSTFTVVPNSQFKWLQKPSGCISFSNNAKRIFCDNCGTYLKWEGIDAEDEAEVNTMCLTNPAVVTIHDEIFTRSRVPWVSAVVGAKQYLAGRS